MGTSKNGKINNPRPYATRRVVDSSGREHWHLYVPSKRGYAWIELFEMPNSAEELREFDAEGYQNSKNKAEYLRRLILNPEYIADWKVAWCEEAYKLYRQRCNEAKRKDVSYAEWQSSIPYDVALYADEIADPQDLYIRKETEAESKRLFEEVLRMLTKRQRRYVLLSIGDQMSYIDIARLEHPEADKEEVNKYADAIRKCVGRAITKVRCQFGVNWSAGVMTKGGRSTFDLTG